MNNKNYLSVIAGIDEELIARSEQKNEVIIMSKKDSIKKVFVPIAACLVVVFAVVAVFTTGNNKKPSVSPSDTKIIIDSFKGDTDSSSCYVTPNPGEYYCFVDVDRVRKENKNENVDFLLGFDIFNGKSELTEEEKEAEYQRLVKAGYRLYKATCWTYEGEGEKVEQNVVVGLFTESELADFDVNPDYGYAFRFVTNGDGSPVSIDESQVLK